MLSKRRIYGFAFVLPLLVLQAIFVAYPLGRGVYYSFTAWDGISSPRWIGIGNYTFLIHYGAFHRFILNNLFLAMGIVVWIALPFTLALAIQPLRRANTVRTLLFFPVLLPPIIVGSVFRVLLSDQGPFATVLRKLGLGVLALPWLTDDHLVLAAIVGIIAWATLGTGILFYTAGLAAIPESQIEAARIDGARWRHIVWFIYRPALRPVTRFWMLLLTISALTGFFPWIYSFSQGGPGNASTTLDYAVFTIGIVGNQYGVACAIAVVSIVLIASLVSLQVLSARLRR